MAQFTFNEHPEEIGQVEVVKEDDDDTRTFISFASVQLLINKIEYRFRTSAFTSSKASNQ